MRARTISEKELKELRDEDFSEDEDIGEETDFEEDEEPDPDQEAAVVAASDAGSAEKLPDAAKVSYKIRLANEYRTMDGERVREIDLSGLEDLTTMDAQQIDRIMDKLNHYPRNRYRDTVCCKHIAMLVTGYDADFFNQMKWVDMNRIVSRIAIYFLFN